MSNTVGHKEIHNWWDGKVVIDELKEFKDGRGSVFETWRSDDDKNTERPPAMCYSSFTNPYIQRGPHQHANQVDFFVTYKNKMVYQLYNPETNEMKIYFTNKDAITKVRVAPPIIHSYRNLENFQIFTSNFPSSLFMGKDKKEEIDEIRHEHHYYKNKVLVVFGCNGRLGKSFTKNLFDNMSCHKYDVVPVDKKLHTKDDVNNFFVDLDNSMCDEKGNKLQRDVYFINCSAYSNVQEADNNVEKVMWANADMPFSLLTECTRRNWKFIHFSTDYVYQTVSDGSFYDELGTYTKSKIQFERLLKDAPLARTKNCHIFRVANLYSTDVVDTCNVFGKFNAFVNGNANVKITNDAYVMPTDVDSLSSLIINTITSKAPMSSESFVFYNILSKKYKLYDLLKEFFKLDDSRIEYRKAKTNPWHNKFESPTEGEIVITINNDYNKVMDYINTLNKV